MLQIIKPSHDDEEAIDWHQVWRDSPEFKDVKQELGRLNSLATTQPEGSSAFADGDASQHNEFVASFSTQFREVLIRTWKHFWRSPTYIWSKTILIVLAVSCSQPRTEVPSLTFELVTVPWLQFQRQQQHPGPPEPAFRCLHVPCLVWKHQRADHAHVCPPARFVRGSRKAFQDLPMEQ